MFDPISYSKIKDTKELLDNLYIDFDELEKLIGLKVDKQEGKGLSSNDFTDQDKQKLAGIEEGANKYTHPTAHPASMIIETDNKKFVSEQEKQSWNSKSDFSGSYNDLTDKPHIPSLEDAVSKPQFDEHVNLIGGETVAGHYKVGQGLYTDDQGAIHASVKNKSDIGLGNVENYKVATKEEAELGGSNSTYMTPLRTKEAIEKQVKSIDLDNPPAINDLNLATKAGWYSFTFETVNIPQEYNGLSGVVRVESTDNNLVQTAYVMRDKLAEEYPGGEDYKHRIYTRFKGSNGWTEWVRLMDETQGAQYMDNLLINMENITLGRVNNNSYRAITVGNGATTSNELSEEVIAIGNGSYNSGHSSIAIGNVAGINVFDRQGDDYPYVYGYNAIAIGSGSVSFSNSCVALGGNSTSGKTEENGTPIESLLYSHTTAIGPETRAEGKYSTALGAFAEAYNDREGTLGSMEGTNKWKVPGDFTVEGTKNFEIPHPHPDKRSTHRLRHSAVESPTAGDNLYRFTVQASQENETVEMKLPDYFQYLNKNIDVWVNGHMHFGRAFGVVEGDTLKVTCELPGPYKVLVIGTRNDDHESIQNWDIKGVEREVGESWTGETFVIDSCEIIEVEETKEVLE